MMKEGRKSYKETPIKTRTTGIVKIAFYRYPALPPPTNLEIVTSSAFSHFAHRYLKNATAFTHSLIRHPPLP